MTSCVLPPDDCPCTRPEIVTLGSAYRLGCRCARTRAHNSRTAKHRRCGILIPAPVGVDPTGTIRRLRALAAIGQSTRSTAEVIGWTVPRLSTLRSGNHRGHRLHQSPAYAIAAHYELVCMTPGDDRKIRGYATRNRWASPLAWDGIDIDDPDAAPDLGARSLGRIDLDDVDHLHRAGCSLEEIAARMGVAAASIDRARLRARAA